jgi:DNA repair exonuclease SbcCD ATPase subunit
MTPPTPEQLIAEVRKRAAACGPDQHGFGCNRDGEELIGVCSICGPPQPNFYDQLADALTDALKERDEERIAHNHFAVVMEQRALSAESKLTAALERIKHAEEAVANERARCQATYKGQAEQVAALLERIEVLEGIEKRLRGDIIHAYGKELALYECIQELEANRELSREALDGALERIKELEQERDKLQAELNFHPPGWGDL